MARWFAAILGLLALVLLVRLVLEWRRYVTGRHVIGRRQMTLRIVSAVDLVVLLALVLTGAGVNFPTATSAFVYWAACLVLALAAMIMAIADLRMLKRTHGERRAESYRKLSMYIRRVEQSRERRATRGE
ncbi:MAG: hypothetical protein ACLFU7_09415 [Armatimonadota bacterium]